jgi:Multicopper oxidase.
VNHQLTIVIAQRYSFVLKADKPIDNYWIRALPNNGRTQGFANGVNSAILRYRGAPANDPITNQVPNVKPLKETDLHPLTNPGSPGAPNINGADIRINLDLGFNTTAMLFSINGATFVPPTVPVLLQILSGAQAAQDLLPPGSVYTLPRDKVVEVSMPAGVIGGPVRDERLNILYIAITIEIFHP